MGRWRRSPGRRHGVLDFVDGRGRRGVLGSGILRNSVTDLIGDVGTVDITGICGVLDAIIREGIAVVRVGLSNGLRLGLTRRRHIVYVAVIGRVKTRVALAQLIHARGLRGLRGLRGSSDNLVGIHIHIGICTRTRSRTRIRIHIGIVLRSLSGGPLLDLPLQGGRGEPHGGATLEIAIALGNRLGDGLDRSRRHGSRLGLGLGLVFRLRLRLRIRLRRNLRLGNNTGHMHRGGDTSNGTTPVSGTPRRRTALRRSRRSSRLRR
ncbi:hypothetical protein GCM10009837_60290 [Streptomyces durmitorensis]